MGGKQDNIHLKKSKGRVELGWWDDPAGKSGCYTRPLNLISGTDCGKKELTPKSCLHTSTHVLWDLCSHTSLMDAHIHTQQLLPLVVIIVIKSESRSKQRDWMAPESGQLATILHVWLPQLHRATASNKLMLFSTVDKLKVGKSTNTKTQPSWCSHPGTTLKGWVFHPESPQGTGWVCDWVYIATSSFLLILVLFLFFYRCPSQSYSLGNMVYTKLCFRAHFLGDPVVES